MAKVSPSKEEGHTGKWVDRTHSLRRVGLATPGQTAQGEEGSHLEVFNPHVGVRNRNELLGLVMGQGNFYVKCA